MLRFLTATTLAFVLVACGAKEPTDFKEDKALYEYALRLFDKKNYAESIPFFESLRNRFPESPYVVDSELKAADAQFRKGDYLEAEVAYSSFRTLHPTHSAIVHVVKQIGLCHFEQIPGGPDRDQAETEKALRTFEELKTRWPESAEFREISPRMEKCKRLLDGRELYVANFYLKHKQYSAAIGRLKTLYGNSEFPDTRQEAAYKLGLAYSKMNEPDSALPYLKEASQGTASSSFGRRAATLLGKLQKK